MKKYIKWQACSKKYFSSVENRSVWVSQGVMRRFVCSFQRKYRKFYKSGNCTIPERYRPTSGKKCLSKEDVLYWLCTHPKNSPCSDNTLTHNNIKNKNYLSLHFLESPGQEVLLPHRVTYHLKIGMILMLID